MLRFAARNLLSRPLRSLLALLGLSVAIVGMVGLFAVAGGLDELVATTFGRIPGLIVLQPGAPIPLFSRIPAEWGEELAAVPGVRTVNAEIWQRINIIDGKTIVSPPRFLFGTDIGSRIRLKHDVYQEEIEQGRFLSEEDIGTRNAVVSRQIAEEFNKGVGDTLAVNRYDMQIVGIYHCGSLLLDVAIIVDIDQVRRISRFDADSVCGFYVEQTGEVSDEVLEQRIQTVFRGRRGSGSPLMSALGATGGSPAGQNVVSTFFRYLDRRLKSLTGDENKSPAAADRAAAPEAGARDNGGSDNGHNAASKAMENDASQVSGDPTDSPTGRTNGETDDVPVEVRTAVDWAERFDDFSADLNLFLVIMTSIGVTIAVLSIINTMFMSVSERIIEIGILKANGWSGVDVMKLITFESAILGVGGGVLGGLVGWLATHVINWYWPDRIHLFASPGLLAFSVVFSTALGIIGGLYPAVWAMRMMPMDAIRRG